MNIADKIRSFLFDSHRNSSLLLAEALPIVEAACAPPPIIESTTVSCEERDAMAMLFRVAVANTRSQDVGKTSVRVERQLLIDMMRFLLDVSRSDKTE